MKEQAEQLVESVQDLVETLQQATGQNDLDEKRKQLKAVSRSVSQLEKQGVSVPDELRHLKMDLASDLGVVDEAEATLSFLALELGQLIDAIGKPRRKSKTKTSRHRRKRKPTTGREVLRDMIHECLKESGGRARASDVLDWIGERLDGQFQPGDSDRRAGGEIVWRNNAQWERLRMIKEGVLKSNSPRGWWELAEGD